MSTIFAVATAPGRSAIAVVRVSGPATSDVLKRVAGSLPPPRRASLRTLKDPSSGQVIDQALLLWLPGPNSFTGEDQAELHLHGGPAVLAATFSVLSAEGLELAKPGAFTRRAFENGKVDLVQAEAIADLVDAETEAQRRQAVLHLGGAPAIVQERWRNRLMDVSALVEASIDFADEALPEGLLADARVELRGLRQELARAAEDVRGERIRDGFRVAIIGEPNAGKSTLFNSLLARNASIVTDIAGTTRDVIEAGLVLEGYSVVIADTAGLRPPADVIEAEGVRRAQAWASSADLRLYVFDQSRVDFDAALLSDVRPSDILVMNKRDLQIGPGGDAALQWACEQAVSVQYGGPGEEHAAQVAGAISKLVVERLSGHDPPVATRLRHRKLINEALGHIDRALEPSFEPELFAEDVRLAAQSLKAITGGVDTEQILERIFSTFCIGK